MQAARLKKTAELLRTSRLQIGEIALACGFNNIGYFHKVFKNIITLRRMSCRPRSNGQEIFRFCLMKCEVLGSLASIVQIPPPSPFPAKYSVLQIEINLKMIIFVCL